MKRADHHQAVCLMLFFVENVFFTNDRVRVISCSYKTADGIWCKCALGSSQIQVRMTKAENKEKNLYYDVPQKIFYLWREKNVRRRI